MMTSRPTARGLSCIFKKRKTPSCIVSLRRQTGARATATVAEVLCTVTNAVYAGCKTPMTWRTASQSHQPSWFCCWAVVWSFRPKTQISGGMVAKRLTSA